MRKTYEKPMIMFESFASSVNIASNCEVIVEGPAYGSCGYEWIPGNVLFLDAEGSPCYGDHGAVGIPLPEYGYEDGVAPEPFGPYDKLCYHIPSGDNMFNS